MTTISRTAPGVPQGGEFASRSRAEAEIDLGSELTVIYLDTPDLIGGYDEIRTGADGYIAYFRDNKLHRENGPALNLGFVNDPTGEFYSVWLDGEVQTAPDDSGLHFAGLHTDGAGQPEQEWASAGGNRRVYVDTQGRETHTQDGDIHRLGAPAITGGDTPDIWVVHGNLIDSPIPAPASEVRHGSDRTGLTVFTGSRFETGMTPATAAEQIRKYIKSAQYAGVISDEVDPDKSMRVRVVGKPSISSPQVVHIKFTPKDRNRYLNPKREEQGETWFTPEGARVDKLLTDIGNSYNQWEDGPAATPGHRGFYVETAIS